MSPIKTCYLHDYNRSCECNKVVTDILGIEHSCFVDIERGRNMRLKVQFKSVVEVVQIFMEEIIYLKTKTNKKQTNKQTKHDI